MLNTLEGFHLVNNNNNRNRIRKQTGLLCKSESIQYRNAGTSAVNVEAASEKNHDVYGVR